MKYALLSISALLLTAPAWAMEPVAPAATTPSVAPSTTAPAAPAAAPVAAPAATQPAPRRAQDRLELDTTQITGNRELPRVLYVVPWKRPDLGDLSGRPANSLLDEVLAPVDRDVFRRQNRYYQALKPDAPDTVEGGGTEVEK
jgi:hypothetical protein